MEARFVVLPLVVWDKTQRRWFPDREIRVQIEDVRSYMPWVYSKEQIDSNQASVPVTKVYVSRWGDTRYTGGERKDGEAGWPAQLTVGLEVHQLDSLLGVRKKA